MKRELLIILAIIIFSFSGCAENEKKQEAIVFWSSNNQDEILFSQKVVKSWNATKNGKKVKFQPVPEGQSSEEIILAAVVGETTPDIYANMWQGDVEAYADAGVLIPLDTLDGFWDFIYERCDSSVVEEVISSDGHIYQIPWKVNPIMMIYNKKLLSEIGFENPPETYEEYLRAAKLFSVDKNKDGYVDQWIGYSEVKVTWWQRLFDFYTLYLAASDGAPLIKNNKAVFNNEYSIEVFKFLQTLYKNNYFTKERLSARQDVFLSGIIATRFTGPWEISHAEKFKPSGFEYSFSSIPVPEKSNSIYTYGDPKNIVIFNTCKEPESAWRFLKTMINEDGDSLLLSITNQLPRRKDLNTNEKFVSYLQQNPKLKPFAKQANYLKGTDACTVMKEVFDLISQEYEACVIYGVKSPEQAIKDAEDAVNLLLNN